MPRAPVLLPLILALAVGCDPGGAPRPAAPAPPAPATTPVDAGSVPPHPARSRYRPPVSAPVVDGFRPPPSPFAAGNRGVEYDTTPGTPVGAIGPGRVLFAGPVGGGRHVTVLHGDGLRSSYSHLATLAVVAGDRVLIGQAVGTASGRLHLGVRAGDAYLDPALLFDAGPVHLVPHT